MDCPFEIGDMAIATAPDAWGRWQIYEVLEIFEGANTLSFEVEDLKDAGILGHGYVQRQTISFNEMCIKMKMLVFGEKAGYQWKDGTAYFWDRGIDGLVHYSPYSIAVIAT
jgi:hypothetical protein